MVVVKRRWSKAQAPEGGELAQEICRSGSGGPGPQGDHDNSEATLVSWKGKRTNHFLTKAQNGNRAALIQLSSGTEQLRSEGFGHIGKPL